MATKKSPKSGSKAQQPPVKDLAPRGRQAKDVKGGLKDLRKTTKDATTWDFR